MRIPVRVIESTLKKLVTQNYIAGLQQYYQMALLSPGGTTRSQGSLDAYVLQGKRGESEGGNTTQQHSHLDVRRLKLKLRTAESTYQSKKRKASEPIDLCAIDGVGASKKRKFNNLGIDSAQDLLKVIANQDENPSEYRHACTAFTREHDAKKAMPRYSQKITQIIKETEQSEADAKSNVVHLRNQISEMEEELTGGGDNQNAPEATTEGGTTDTSIGTPNIEAFPKFEDPAGYNGKFFSSHYIECILETHHAKRKPGMVHRMTNRSGEVLSIDSVYGPAKRVVVYVHGKPFRPYKGLTTIMNEHAEVIWFGYIKGGESVSEIRPHLQKLKARLDRIQGPDKLKVIYVDNCCKVRNQLQQIFGPDVQIKLDIFHWQQRWNDVIREKNSQRHSTFRALMSRAVLQASSQEFEEKKTALTVKLGCTPSVRQILALCNTKTPPVPEMRRSICAIVEYFLLEDARAVTQNTGDNDPKPALFFKDTKLVRDKLANQLSHLECLADPPGVCLHRETPKRKKCCARGSGKNELLNRMLNGVFGLNIIGLSRADRDTWLVSNEWNQMINVKRRGAPDYHVNNLEALAYCNALAEKAGCPQPFQISLPNVHLATKDSERFGFHLCSGEDIVMDDPNENTVDTDELDLDDDSESESNHKDVHGDVERIQGLIHAAHDTRLSRPRSSLQTFTAMTGRNAWLPFSDDMDETSKEERHLFEEMCPNYSRHAKSGTRNCYAEFSKAWDIEAERIYLARLGGEDCIPIHCKTARQLVEYADKLAERKAAAALATPAGIERLRSVNRILKHARININMPQVVQAQPIVFPQAPPGARRYTPLCDPVTMNASVAFPMGVPMNQGCTQNGANPFVALEGMKQHVPLANLNHSTTLFRKVCRKCGPMKGEHQRSKTHSLFGPTKCGFQHCDRCMLAQSCHASGKMGVFCTVNPATFPSVQAGTLSQFDAKISQLQSK